jgi:hypothetical protein
MKINIDMRRIKQIIVDNIIIQKYFDFNETTVVVVVIC